MLHTLTRSSNVKTNTLCDPRCLKSLTGCHLSTRKRLPCTKQQIYSDQKKRFNCVLGRTLSIQGIEMINRVIIDCGLLQQRKLSIDVICTQGPPLRIWILFCLLLHPPQREKEKALLSRAMRIFGRPVHACPHHEGILPRLDIAFLSSEYFATYGKGQVQSARWRNKGSEPGKWPIPNYL